MHLFRHYYNPVHLKKRRKGKRRGKEGKGEGGERKTEKEREEKRKKSCCLEGRLWVIAL